LIVESGRAEFKEGEQYETIKAPMTVIGSIGSKDEADNPTYRVEWRHSLNGEPGSVLTVDCTFSRRTN
jgi:hypothetical protein